MVERVAGVGGVIGVTLGGSRARGTHRPDSDWDFGLYYRGDFDPQQLRAIGWEGTVFELGAWGGGVFNGGAWLHIDGRKVDVLYRDLEVVEHELAEARAGRFHREPLLFHIAGIPSYLVVGELAINRVLRGTLPRPQFPAALRTNAPRVWNTTADHLFDYVRVQVAPRGQAAECVALLVTAAMCTAHAVLAARGEWCVNEKQLLNRAGLRDIDEIVCGLRSGTADLARSVSDVAELCRNAR
ncbi:MAG: nucleotidyltransferase domain-containing protein [Aldersonia sp.]|nr:nucleotidyltransferase domain-containing protein [Aldersonia sp.]